MSAFAVKTGLTVDKTERSRLPLRGLRLRHSYVGSSLYLLTFTLYQRDYSNLSSTRTPFLTLDMYSLIADNTKVPHSGAMSESSTHA